MTFKRKLLVAALPFAFCLGSWLWPQKMNPAAAGLLRGKSARLQGNLHTLLTLAKGLPLTYNRDLQEDKERLFDSIDTLKMALAVHAEMITAMQVNGSVCRAAASDPSIPSHGACRTRSRCRPDAVPAGS